jgi:hypothetical protein
MPELFEPDIHINQLTVEGPKTEPQIPFDPNVELTESDWEHLVEFGKGVAAPDIVRYGSNIHILAPERIAQDATLEEIDTIAKNNCSSNAQEHRRSFEWRALLFDLYYLSIIDPEAIPKLELTDYEKDSMLRIVEHSFEDKEFIANASLRAASFKIVFPEQFGALVKRKKLNFVPITNEILERKLPSIDMGTLAGFKLLFPDAFRQIKIPPYYWDRVREDLESRRTKDNWGSLIEEAAYATMVAAHSIDVDHGLEITIHPPNKFESTKEMPVQSNY